MGKFGFVLACRAPATTHPPTHPTTVQITIHQPKNTVSNATAVSDRLVTNTHFSAPVSSHYTNPHVPVQVPQMGGTTPQALQRLVISQSPAGVTQSRTAGKQHLFVCLVV